jgi:excinuclease ABC subunit C
MKDHKGTVIYVGKAAQLKKRLSSYFSSARQADTKTKALIANIASFEVIITGSEKEALILESNLIKRHKPRYNVELKDDKRYPCLRVGTRHPYPKLAIVRQMKKDGAVYFGPYASAGAVRQTAKIVDKTFKLRKCSDREFKGRLRPCLHHQMHRCLAPCCLDVSQKAYQRQLREVILFLNGRTPKLIKKIRMEMIQEAERQNYEKAAALRDKLFALEKTLQKQIVVSADLKDRDVIAFFASEEHALVTMLYVRGGFLLGKRHFRFNKFLSTEAETVGMFMRQFYDESHFIPKEILVSHYPEDATLMEEVLGNIKGSRVRILFPQRGPKRGLLNMAQDNAKTGIQELLESEAYEMDLMTRLAERLNLGRFPERIECFDNSNIFGSASVSGMVVFVMGKPQKQSYRKYHIKTVDLGDDYAIMAEVLKRRYRVGDKKAPLPDLLIVDGGKGQLNIAASIIEELGLDGAFDLIGIAKKDEKKGEAWDKIYQKGRSNPVSFGRDKDPLRFLERVRDEAHRFALAFHRQQRGKAFLHSVLDDIPGIGKKRKKILLKHFASIQQIRDATLKELASLPGMNRKVSAALKAKLGTS